MGAAVCAPLAACDRPDAVSPIPAPHAPVDAAFVGRGACVECHQAEHDLWTGSHHDLAMDLATPETVLGDFADATLEHFGVVSRMYTRDGAYLVETDGPDGALREYAIKYVFGVYPLQQYLVEFPGGRVQTLPLCWDSRPAEQGGERWFHIYPDEPIPAGDELHWTGGNQNWNHMCAECHSTDLHKNYDLQTDTFATTWSEIDVSCEACHGPGSAHVAWAEAERDGQAHAPDPAMGLVVSLKSGDAGIWRFEPGAPTATRTEPRASQAELEACARCHSRRGALTDDYHHGSHVLDTHLVSLLEEGLYFADGQFRDEVYEYGSFRQSRMHAMGVTCSDCHDPHSGRTIAGGNDLCAKCHMPTVFDAEPHHRHPGARGDPGSNCRDCHMPARTYMGVDVRYDHSFRVPRPDLSERLGTPNACNICHADQSPQWAAGHVAEWYGPKRRAEWHYGEAIHAGREGLPAAADLLARLAGDPAQPAIARATAVTLLASASGADLLSALRAVVGESDGLLRLAAAQAAEGLPLDERAGVLAPLLRDPLLAVRAEAARVLAPAVAEHAPPDVLEYYARAERDYIAGQMANADRPESHLNLGNLHAARGRIPDAEREYAAALRLDARFVPASVNLADLRRSQGRDADAERVLRDALRLSPQSAPARHALGLTLVRLQRREEALTELRLAADYAPQVGRYAYVYAVALDSLGRPRDALDVLRLTLQAHPADRAVLEALAGICLREGLADEAASYRERLRRLGS